MPAGNVTPASCAVLGRTRYGLLPVEKEFGLRGIPYFKRVTALHENESDLADDFQLALRTVANPPGQLQVAALLKRWNLRLVDEVMSDPAQITALLKESATATSEARCHAIADAINLIGKASTKLNMKPAIDVLRNYADTLSVGEKEAIYDRGHAQRMGSISARQLLPISNHAGVSEQHGAWNVAAT